MRPDQAEHLLEVAGVAGPDQQDPVRLARDGPGLDHLRDRRDELGHPVRRDAPLAVELDERLDRPAQRGRRDLRGEPLDGAVLTQPVDAPLGRRRAQPDMAAEGGIALSPVLSERRKDLAVDVINAQWNPPDFARHATAVVNTGKYP